MTAGMAATTLLAGVYRATRHMTSEAASAVATSATKGSTGGCPNGRPTVTVHGQATSVLCPGP